VSELPARRTGIMDRDLALFPGWQLGRAPRQQRIARRDLLGAIARAEGASISEPELDSLTWVLQEWHDQGSPLDGRVKFTWYAMGRDLYGNGRKRWKPSGGYRDQMREAIDNLHAVVITLRSINALTGERGAPTLRSKVHILETVVDHEQIQLFRDGDVDGGQLGGLRDETIEIRIADWLVHQLLAGYLVLDWATQRRLSGAAKRLWYELSGRVDDFEPAPLEERCLTIELDGAFYEAMNLRATRERDNRLALANAAARVVAADPKYRAITIVQGDSAFFLRAIERAPRARLSLPG
jgi:hypothetical protein